MAEGRLMPTLKETGQMLLTFVLAVFGWIIFRAESIGQAWNYVCGIFNSNFFEFEGIPRKTMVFVIVMIIIEWVHREKTHGLEIRGKHFLIRWSYYLLIVAMIFVYGAFNESFIYFQF